VCNRIISAFFRFSPFSADIKSLVSQVEVRNGNVIRSLPEGKDLIWQEYDKTVRHHIRRADSLGLKVEVDAKGKRMNDFLRIYYETMRRRNALPYYYFPERLFNNIFQTIPGSAMLFHVTNGNTVISSEMVLLAEKNMYAFLGGTDGRFTDMNSGELLSNSIINWGIENGKKQYVMGGGYRGHDGIFQFKKKFAPNGTVPFEVGKHIFERTAYINMCERRKDYERQQCRDWAEDLSYFPAYRTQYD
jgi:lipid II:glycine glycyltransferase (peptidoglycan interpeptide bridge formation enzyme)